MEDRDKYEIILEDLKKEENFNIPLSEYKASIENSLKLEIDKHYSRIEELKNVGRALIGKAYITNNTYYKVIDISEEKYHIISEVILVFEDTFVFEENRSVYYLDSRNWKEIPVTDFDELKSLHQKVKNLSDKIKINLNGNV